MAGGPGATLARVLGGPLGPVAPLQPAPARLPRRHAGNAPGLAGTARGGATSHGLLALRSGPDPHVARRSLIPGRARDPEPTVRVASGLAWGQPPVVKSWQGTSTATLAESSQRGTIPWGRIRFSGMKASPVTARTRTSKASWVRSLPSPRWVLLQSLRPVKLQAGRGRCFRGRSSASGNIRARATR